jgi:GntR family transcriptional regulator
MFEEIDPRSPTPLYEQIAARVRLAVASADLVSGDALPSVRQLARTLRVNPATVVQAYRELESDGFVEMRHGAGTFVRDVSVSRKDDERQVGATEIVRGALQEAARMGIPAVELYRALRAELGVESVGEGVLHE